MPIQNRKIVLGSLTVYATSDFVPRDSVATSESWLLIWESKIDLFVLDY